MRLTVFVDGAPTMRMVLAVVVAALVWLGVLVAMGHWLGTSAPVLPHEPPLEMRVVELEPPPAPAPPPPPKEPVSRALPAANQPKPVAPRPNALPEHIAPKPTDARPVQSTASTVSSPPPATNESRPTAESATHATPAPANEKPNASTGDTAAHPIAQPLPELPDDLREQAYQTVATAHFTIHTDGSIDVDLIKPTPNPRLNQILLEVLHQWRFSPAMQTGHPVESRQDIRVHFNVD